jgi:uncharacterized protein
MTMPVVEVTIRAMAVVKDGFAVFIGNQDKVFVMVVDRHIGTAITKFLQRRKSGRPLTHDLLMSVVRGLGAKIERVVFYGLQRSAYLARLVLSAENRSQQIIEIDARPGDCLVLAAAQGAPIFVNLEVWSQVDDVKLTLRKLQEESSRSDESG